MEKDTGVLWQEEYAPKGCSSRRARIEDKVGDGNICGVWGCKDKTTKMQENQG